MLKKTIINPGDTIDLSSTNDGWFVKKGNLKYFFRIQKILKINRGVFSYLI